MSEAEFWTLSEVLSWFMMILTNTHRVEQHSIRLRVEIGFSEILVFGAPTLISEPSPPPENRWSEVKTGPKWSQTFTTKPSGPLCSLKTEPVVSGASYLACRRLQVDIRIFGVLAIKLNLISRFPPSLAAILERFSVSGDSLTFTNRLGRAPRRLDRS